MRRTPFDVYEFKGSFYDIGRQYGEACRERIKETIEEVWVRMIKAYNPEADKKQMVAIGKRFLDSYKGEPDLLDELKGIAEGANVNFDEVLFIQTGIELLEYWPKLVKGETKVNPAKIGGCTSFAATGKATKNGETISGQNEDWIPTSEPILMRLQPDKGPRVLGLTLPGCFVTEGINSAGLACQANLIVTTNSGIGIPPDGGMRQKVLHQKNIGDALGAIYTTKRASASNFVIASDEGDIIDVEATRDDVSVLHPQNYILVHTNNLVTERFKDTDLMAQLLPDSYLRVNRMRRLMEEHYGELSVDIMKKLLTDHNGRPDSICRHLDVEDPPDQRLLTVASIISVPREQKMYISNGNPCENDYLEYRL